MAEDRKYRYGLKKTKYAVWDTVTESYGELKELPGAVSLSLSAEGGDGSDFYADDGIWATFPGTNGGYSGDLELANIPDEARVALLGEVIDPATGLQFETTDAEPPEFALVTEAQTNIGPIATVLYSVKATRPEFNANTKGENVDVDTETLSLRIGAREFSFNGEKKKFVKGTLQKSNSNADEYAAFFEDIVIPSAGADTTLSALTIGSLTLTPAFDGSVTSYAAETSNATNTITATATDSDATVEIRVGDDTVENGGSATWDSGENTVTVTVTNGAASRVYTVTVTKSE